MGHLFDDTIRKRVAVGCVVDQTFNRDGSIWMLDEGLTSLIESEGT